MIVPYDVLSFILKLCPKKWCDSMTSMQALIKSFKRLVIIINDDVCLPLGSVGAGLDALEGQSISVKATHLCQKDCYPFLHQVFVGGVCCLPSGISHEILEVHERVGYKALHPTVSKTCARPALCMTC